MAEKEILLMKGNEAIAHAAIRCGCDAYFGYPITPQSEVIETLAELKPWETTGMVVLQAESEVASINMVYGAAGAGKKVLSFQVYSSTCSVVVLVWELSSLHRVTISSLLVVVVMVTIMLSFSLHLQFRRWQTSWISLSHLHSSIACQR